MFQTSLACRASEVRLVYKATAIIKISLSLVLISSVTAIFNENQGRKTTVCSLWFLDFRAYYASRAGPVSLVGSLYRDEFQPGIV